jgi:hypothetical protein
MLSFGLQLGCGITAFNYIDALNILSETIFKDKKMPGIKKCIENIDIRNLDQNHVIPNMWAPNIRGIWYPLGYQDTI